MNKSLYITAERFDKIKEELNELLARENHLFMEELPAELIPSFEKFLIGKTRLIKDGRMLIYYRDFAMFYNYLWNKESDIL